jgi:phosphoserine phosphatase RsbU/P
LTAVRRYEILDTPRDGAFDRVAAMAARLLAVPVATVTIVDADRIWFKAAYGLDGVTQIGRDPGLCASAVLQGVPLVIDDTQADPVARDNPLVVGEMGARFYAAAPIVTGDGYRLGTVNVLDVVPRQITDSDVATLTDLAALVMDQLELRLSALAIVRTERDIRAQVVQDKAELAEYASTLQRTLLPPVLPKIPGMEVDAHFQPSSTQEVGGDFYDVFAIGDGRWAFFLGDVCGKGAPAAALTSLIRYTLRAAALHDPDPVAVLGELNTAMLLDPSVAGRFCTAMFATIRPGPGGPAMICLGTGGHPPGFVLRPARAGRPAEVEPVRPAGGMLVGAIEQAVFAAITVALHPGEALLLYTDGLIEACPDGKTRLGERGLADHLATALTTHSEHRHRISACQVIAESRNALNGSGQGDSSCDDDVAMLALSVPATASAGDAAGHRGTLPDQREKEKSVRL